MKTFTQLSGTTSATSSTLYPTSFGTLSQNNSTANIALGKGLMNDQHRYLLQKYFDNERTSTITTVGGFTLTVTSAPALAATSATLSSAWIYPTCTQLVNFSDGTQQSALFTASSTAITWDNALIGTRFILTAALSAGATTATLSSAWAYSTASKLVQFSDGEQKTVTFTASSTSISWSGGLSATVSAYLNTSVATTTITTVGVQDYQIPANISKIKDNTISVGQLKFVCQEIMSIQEWDRINFLPYTSDIPAYIFIYNNKLKIFPIPSTTGNILSFNYKTRVADMSYADYSVGTLASGGMVVGSTAVTGLASLWATGATAFPQNVDISFQNLCIKADTPYGDGIWYPIRKFNSDTSLTLVNPVINAPNITAATTYTIGQIPILSEDFHDMLVHGALKVYFSSIVDNPNKFKEFDTLYKERLELLANYAGTKAVQVDLGEEPSNVNPNLFLYST